ncbi:MAG TPA: hypothetical protein ENI27_02465, partial [bacterium]|nr:hypothetical protein [bacterium]
MKLDLDTYVRDIYDAILRRYFPLSVDESIIYHYTRFAALKSIITGNIFHATNVHYMNDPTELHYAQELLQDAIASVRYQYSANRRNFPGRYLEEHVIPKIEERDTQQFVLSFTFESDSRYLWHSYGASDGYALVFSIPDLVGALQRKELRLGTLQGFAYQSFSLFHGRVLYDKSRQRRLLNLLLKRILPLVEMQMQSMQEGRDDTTIAEATVQATYLLYACIYNMKSAAFSVENEYRIVVMPDCGFGNIKYKNRNGQQVPYVELGGCPLPFHQVVIGPAIRDASA